MALWHDPLDELIGELERTLPVQARPADFDVLPPLEDVQLAIQAALSSHAGDCARVEQDPRVLPEQY